MLDAERLCRNYLSLHGLIWSLVPTHNCGPWRGYAQDEVKEKFAEDFVAAWAKVKDLDRFDVK
jgi:hypothetical protein